MFRNTVTTNYGCGGHESLSSQRLLARSVDALGGAQMSVYEDNFGFWDISGREERRSLTTYSVKAYWCLASVATGKSGSFRPKPSALVVSQRSNAARRLR
jgi:hypothetical protein